VRPKKKLHRFNDRQYLRERQQKYYQAFSHVVECYKEIKSVNGTMSCGNFYRHLSGEHSGSVGGVIHVSLSDFTSDVELAIRAVLQLGEAPTDLDSLTNPQKERIGKELMRRKIYPLHPYLKPKSVNDKRKKR